jgi:3-hydroxyisobutyrate dehydrogenase/glyoxylate/succinic semialdehyde reductase
MGREMVRRLLDQGCAVTVYSRRHAVPEELSSRVRLQPSARRLGESVRLVVLMVPDGPACEDILFGDEGLADGLAPGSLVVNMSTVGRDWARRLAARLEHRALDYLDAPVLGSRDAAREGRLVVLTGGTPAAGEKARPLLEILGSETRSVGPVGVASALKLVVNAMLGMGMAAFADAARLAGTLGIPSGWVHEVLPRLPVSPPFLAAKAASLGQADLTPSFPLEWMAKDLGLALDAAAASGAHTPLLRTAAETYRDAATTGRARLDFAAIAT